ncbi:MAG: hypothetical protein ACLPWG_19545 [Steroidobacteraceae bacterium]
MSYIFLERKGVGIFFSLAVYFSAFTGRHMGAARTRETSPAAINSCAS